ncbi:hypothetical protein SGRIM128S_08980 [Streptomyces griseomycini]
MCFSARRRIQKTPPPRTAAATSPPPMAMSVGVAPLVTLPPMPPRTPPRTVKAAGRVRLLPEQWTVMSYDPARALSSMVAVPFAVSLPPRMGVRLVLGNALEVAVPPLGQPSTVMVSLAAAGDDAGQGDDVGRTGNPPGVRDGRRGGDPEDGDRGARGRQGT